MNNKKLFIGSKFIGHDSSIFCIWPEEKEIFAIQTERLTRFKHDNLFPIPAIKKMLAYKKIDPNLIEEVYFGNCFTSQQKQKILRNRYDMQLAERNNFKISYKKDLKDALKLYDEHSLPIRMLNLLKSKSGRYLLKNRIINAVSGKNLITLEEIIISSLKTIFPNAKIKLSFHDHEYCHALSSYYFSPYDKAVLFTYDGWGDDSFSKIYLANEGKLELYCKSTFDKINIGRNRTLTCSIGEIYSYITELLGFEPEQDEGKVEALAAYGNYNNEIYVNLITLFFVNKETKSIEIKKEEAEKILNLDNLTVLIKKYKQEDVAAGVQKFLEHITLEYLEFISKDLKIHNLCLSGGVAANVIMNLDIFEKITPNLYIAPAMADDGAGQGCAVAELIKFGYKYVDLKWLQHKTMPYFSTNYSHDECLRAINTNSNTIDYKYMGEIWPETAAELLASGKIGAIFHGKMEWGPRALGNRSIIADPRRPDFRDKINKEIKRRPYFQPFCPSILAEEKDRLFEKSYLNKHMTCAFRMKKEYWNKLPSAIHIDGTARVQFVEEKDNKDYYRLLRKVKELTGFGVIINTSFNKHGRTIVESPNEAIRDFLDTDMDYLVMEGYLITRKK